jgi:hypothetical protein
MYLPLRVAELINDMTVFVLRLTNVLHFTHYFRKESIHLLHFFAGVQVSTHSLDLTFEARPQMSTCCFLKGWNQNLVGFFFFFFFGFVILFIYFQIFIILLFICAYNAWIV